MQAEIKAFPEHPAIPTENCPPDFEYLFISPFHSLVPPALVICWTRFAGLVHAVMRSRLAHRTILARSTLARWVLTCALLLPGAVFAQRPADEPRAEPVRR